MTEHRKLPPTVTSASFRALLTPHKRTEWLKRVYVVSTQDDVPETPESANERIDDEREGSGKDGSSI